MLNIIRDGNDGWGVGFRYFGLDGGDSTVNRLGAPGQTFTESFNGLDFDDLVQFDAAYSSELHNFELNLHKNIRPGVTVFAGYRFLELDELFSIQAREVLPEEPAIEISRTNVSNQLHGLQFGAQARVFERSRFTLDAGGSAGLYGNHAKQTMFVRDDGANYPLQTISDTEVAFVGDISITGVYRLRDHVSLRAGLQMMWLTDVALAPEQTQTNNFRTNTFAVDNGSDVFYFGGFAGVQCDF
jgi:hypothetical protein